MCDMSLQFIIQTGILVQQNNNNKGDRAMVLNASFNNISAISWWSVLLVQETGVPGGNHSSVASH
jgi:hypothetical protein